MGLETAGKKRTRTAIHRSPFSRLRHMVIAIVSRKSVMNNRVTKHSGKKDYTLK